MHKSAVRLCSLWILLLALLPWAAVAQDAEALLTSPQAVRALDRGLAAKGIPAQVKGVVTFASPRENGSFILDDGITGIYVATSDALNRGLEKPERDFEEPVALGMVVEVTGKTAPGGFAPVIIPRRIRKLGTAELPPVKNVTVPDLQTGQLDCERVRVRGVVQHAEFTERAIDAARLELAGIGGHFVAYAINPQGFDPKRLIDAEVDLSGAALSFFNERAELVGSRVQLQDIRDVAIVRPAPEDPFNVPQAQMDALLPFSPDPPSLHRRRIAGTVTICQPGAYFYVQEGGRAVRVSTRDATPLIPGDRVEVSGFIEMWEYFAEVREAVFRKLGNGVPPEAATVTRETVLAPKAWVDPPNSGSHLDGRRVALRGRLDKVEHSDNASQRLSLDCDGHVIFATLVNLLPAGPEMIPGSEVKVIGVCQVQLNVGRPTLSNPVPTGFQLLVHSPADVEVLRVPPWWTPKRLWLALGGTVTVLALALIWVSLLRKRVSERGEQLAAEIGARQHAALEFDATLRERKRLAADLHDTLEQALTGLALQLEAVDLFKGEDRQRSDQHLQLAQQFLARSREDVRRSVWNLRAQGLEGRTLFEALREMVNGLGAGRPVEICCRLEGQVIPLPDFIAGNLLLLAQESVTNALKHAAPKAITVTLTFDGAFVSLAVRDDGKGFDQAIAPGLQEGHFGLQGMRERVKRLRGTLTIESNPGAGTTIEARVPVE